MMQQQMLRESIVRCAEVFGQSCLADTTTWLEDVEAGLCADQRDSRRSKITQPSLKYDTQRGCFQVGMVYCRDSTYLCAFTENMVNDLSSWYGRISTSVSLTWGRSKQNSMLVPCHVIVFFHLVVPMTWVAISSAVVASLLPLDFLFFEVDFDGSSVSSIFACSLRALAGLTYQPRHMSVRP